MPQSLRRPKPIPEVEDDMKMATVQGEILQKPFENP